MIYVARYKKMLRKQSAAQFSCQMISRNFSYFYYSPGSVTRTFRYVYHHSATGPRLLRNRVYRHPQHAGKYINFII